MTTKAKLKAAYIAALKRNYSFYIEGSKPLELAHIAIDKALSGKMRLQGDSFDEALKESGLPKNITLKALSQLPES